MMKYSDFRKRRSKRNVMDFLYIPVVLVLVAVLVLIAMKVLAQVNTTVDNNGTLEDDNQDTMNTFTNNMYGAYDKGIILGFLAAFIILCISAFLIDVNPLFFVAGLGIFLIILCIIPILANVYIGFAENGDLAVTAGLMPMSNFLFRHYVLFIFLEGCIVLPILYSKTRQ